ncbi:thiolase family protein [Variovorax sp. GB1P17]|uniref:thiolase family protein n=1 Tax=Variovorax sp. GB1P17 TaxID=3443740 RepID=UPI003F459934
MAVAPQEAFLLDGLRTPFGKYKGVLATLSALDLGALAIEAVLARQPWGRNPDGVLMGVVVQAGLGQNPARIAAVHAGISMTTPAMTLNAVCLASLESVCEAARRIRSGEGDSYLVGGFDSMSRAPQLIPPQHEQSNMAATRSALFTDGLGCALSGASMGELSDRVNRELGISRHDQDSWAVMSQQRAAQAQTKIEQSELFELRLEDVHAREDQGIRPETTIEGLAMLKPAFGEGGTITAGNSSQMSDGASAGLVVSGHHLERLQQPALARIVDWGLVAGPDASLHLKPAMAIRRLLKRCGLSVADIDLYEINEAFASVAIASSRDLGLSPEVVNVNGGAIALGHPLGASGFRLLLTLALELRRRNLRRGIATLCGGGGQGLAVLIENCNL